MLQDTVKIGDPNLDSKEGFWGPVTSTIDWCESNYVITIYLAEFWNSISNLAFIIPPLIVAYQLSRSSKIDKIYLLSLIYIAFTGLGSFAFHATLKFEMQLWDELSMVWSALFVLFLVIKILSPQSYQYYIFPLIAYGLITNSIYLFIKIPIIFQAAYAILHFAVLILSYQLSKSFPNLDIRLYWATIICHNVAFILWNLDNNFCYHLNQIRSLILPNVCSPITQFHALWHLLAGYGCFALILFCIQAHLFTLNLNYHLKPDYLAGMTLAAAEEGRVDCDDDNKIMTDNNCARNDSSTPNQSMTFAAKGKLARTAGDQRKLD